MIVNNNWDGRSFGHGTACPAANAVGHARLSTVRLGNGDVQRVVHAIVAMGLLVRMHHGCWPTVVVRIEVGRRLSDVRFSRCLLMDRGHDFLKIVNVSAAIGG